VRCALHAAKAACKAGVVSLLSLRDPPNFKMLATAPWDNRRASSSGQDPSTAAERLERRNHRRLVWKSVKQDIIFSSRRYNMIPTSRINASAKAP
jgi:hypothetical protein